MDEKRLIRCDEQGSLGVEYYHETGELILSIKAADKTLWHLTSNYDEIFAIRDALDKVLDLKENQNIKG